MSVSNILYGSRGNLFQSLPLPSHRFLVWMHIVFHIYSTILHLVMATQEGICLVDLLMSVLGRDVRVVVRLDSLLVRHADPGQDRTRKCPSKNVVLAR